jgi:hypothetical protein
MALPRTKKVVKLHKMLIPALCVGLPLSFLMRYVGSRLSKEWRAFPAKLPHLILIWIQQLVGWTADTFSLQTLVIFWLGLMAIIYFLPSSTRPDFEERRLQAELEALEKEVKDLAEDLNVVEQQQKRKGRGRPKEGALNDPPPAQPLQSKKDR